MWKARTSIHFRSVKPEFRGFLFQLLHFLSAIFFLSWNANAVLAIVPRIRQWNFSETHMRPRLWQTNMHATGHSFVSWRRCHSCWVTRNLTLGRLKPKPYPFPPLALPSLSLSLASPIPFLSTPFSGAPLPNSGSGAALWPPLIRFGAKLQLPSISGHFGSERTHLEASCIEAK